MKDGRMDKRKDGGRKEGRMKEGRKEGRSIVILKHLRDFLSFIKTDLHINITGVISLTNGRHTHTHTHIHTHTHTHIVHTHIHIIRT